MAVRASSLGRLSTLRLLFVVGAAALVARWSTALLTEWRPIFPAHYYADARLYDQEAALFAKELRAGRLLPFRLTPGRELYTNWVGSLYYRFGRHPILPKLINGLLASLSICLWCLLARALAPPGSGASEGPALVLGLTLALWPTHVFYSAQNIKEAMLLLVLAGTFHLFLATAPERAEERLPAWMDLRPVAGACLIMFAGLLSAHLVPMAVGTLLAACLWRLARAPRKRWPRARCAWACAWLVAVFVLFRPFSVMVFSRFFRSFQPETEVRFVRGLVPSSSEEVPRKWTPAWVGEIRKARQRSDQERSERTQGRQVQTQIFSDLEFRGWGDVVRFLPRGAFTVLFMPLPGFYPIDGNLGRLLASFENLVLLAFCILAAVGMVRWGADPARASLAAFFFAFLLAGALFEVDLGSAARHKLLYLPFLLPFAAWEAGRLWARSGRARSVPA